MKIRAAVVWLGALSACGGLLDEGTYDVAISEKSDQCGIGLGGTKDEWIISDEGDGKWSITFDDGGEATGKETGGGDAIVFHGEDYDENGGGGCWVDLSAGITLNPDGDSFKGSFVVGMVASICDNPADDGSSCESSFRLSGEKQ